MQKQAIILGSLILFIGSANQNLVFAENSLPITATKAATAITEKAATINEAAPIAEKAPVSTTTEVAKPEVPATSDPTSNDVKVWVNTKSKAFHCPGTKFYGKTKAGSYMTESEAIAAGNHAAVKGKSCS